MQNILDAPAPSIVHKMEFFLHTCFTTDMHQLDSEDNVPHMFGDAGIGHILQCPDHPEQLSWGWACY